MKNKQGLSTIVTTLIIILLVLVAVGIIWGVVNNLLGKSTGTIEKSAKCLDVSVSVKKINETSPGTYSITLERSSTGEGEVGAKIILFNDNDNTAPIDFANMLSPLEISTDSITPSPSLTNGNYAEVTTFFIDEAGNENICPTTTTHSW